MLALRWRVPQVSVVYIPAAAIANPYVAALSMGLIIAIRGTIGREPIIASRLALPLALCLAWPVYSLMLLPIGQSPIRWISEIGQLILGLTVLLFFSSSVIERRDLALVAKGFVFVGLLLSIVATTRSFLGLSLAQGGPLGPNPDNYSSNLILIALVCLISGVDKLSRPSSATSHRAATILGVVLLLLGIYCNESRASLLMAFVVVFSWYVLAPYKPNRNFISRAVVGVLVAGILIGVAGPSAGLIEMFTSLLDFTGYNFSNLERLALLFHSYELFVEQPLGHGIGSSSALFGSSFFTQGAYPHPHNTLAMFAVEFGVIGLFLYLVLFFSLFRCALRGLRMLSAEPVLGSFCFLLSTVMIAISVYDAMFFNGALAINMFLVLGVLWAGFMVLGESCGRFGRAKNPIGMARV